MTLPPLVHYSTEREYREHYKREYCRRPVFAFDGVRIYFDAWRFEHAFYEGAAKDRFAPVRAERIDWVRATLEHREADLFQGYIKAEDRYAPDRRVSVVYEEFVVVVSLALKRDGALKGKFVTCYQANNSIAKIRNSPRWERELCLRALQRNKGGR